MRAARPTALSSFLGPITPAIQKGKKYLTETRDRMKDSLNALQAVDEAMMKVFQICTRHSNAVLKSLVARIAALLMKTKIGSERMRSERIGKSFLLVRLE